MRDNSREDVELEENPEIKVPDVNEGESMASRKRKALQEAVPTMEERVVRRSQRVKHVTYKASQPEFEKFMRRTKVSSESTTAKEPVREPRQKRKVYSLMALTTHSKTSLEQGSVGDKQECKEMKDREVVAGREDDRGEGGSVWRTEICNTRVGDEHEDCESKREKENEREARSDRIRETRLRPGPENREASSETGGANRKRNEPFLADDEGEEVFAGRGTENRAKGSEQSSGIKGRRIGLNELTNLSEYERYWHNGRLRSHTSLYIEPLNISMQFPPTPVICRVPLPSIPSTPLESGSRIQEALYPPNGLSGQWSGVVLVATTATQKIGMNLNQTIFQLSGTSLVVEDASGLGKHILRGRATITFDCTVAPTYSDGIPIPDSKAMCVLWDDAFRPQRMPRP